MMISFYLIIYFYDFFIIYIYFYFLYAWAIDFILYLFIYLFLRFFRSLFFCPFMIFHNRTGKMQSWRRNGRQWIQNLKNL